MAAVTVTTNDVAGDPIAGAFVSIFDASNVLQDSGLTDGSGIFATVLADSVPGVPYQVIATKDGVAFGNSTNILVTT